MKNWRRLIYLKLARRLSRGTNGTPVPSIISATTNIKGDISSEAIVHVDGRVDGNIQCDELIIGIRGMVNGNVVANSLQLFGTLNGTASVETLFIAKTAKMLGDATHNSIAIEPGAYIDGHCIRKECATEVDQPQAEVTSIDSVRKNKNVG